MNIPKENNTVRLHDGRILGYAEYGNPAGKPVFFFHGWPGSRFSGKETHEAAKKIGLRVISTDRPGIGLSDFKNDRKLLDWPDDVVELADHLKIKKFFIMGVSGGGPYVAVCVYKIPERIIKAGIIVGLAPVNVKGNLDGIFLRSRIGWANYHRFPIIRTIGTIGAAIQFRYLPALGSLISFPTKEDTALYHEAVKNKSGEESGIKEAFRQGIKGAELELKIYTDDWGFLVGNIKSKVYLWYGAKDKCVSLNMARYYKSQIPNSKLFIDPNGVHLSRYKYEEIILKTLTN
jgi:pimeloyl-ACP methyl ester carboxylesterase